MTLGIGLVVLGLGMVILAVYGTWVGVNNRGWPKVTGQVNHARARYVGGVMYSPEVRYTYKVDSIEYEGTSVSSVGKSFVGQEKAEVYLASLVGDGQVDVYHDPRNPERAVLVTGPSWWLAAGTVVSGILIGGLGAIFIIGANGR